MRRIDDATRTQILSLRADGCTYIQIAAASGVSVMAAYRICRSVALPVRLVVVATPKRCRRCGELSTVFEAVSRMCPACVAHEAVQRGKLVKESVA